MSGPPPIPRRPADWSSLQANAATLPSPPPLPPRGAQWQGEQLPPPPPQPARPQPQQQQQQQQSPAQEHQSRQEQYQWTTLFYLDGQPMPIFDALMNAFFTVLDPQNTGVLTPEVFSSWLEMNQMRTDENLWKSQVIKHSSPGAGGFFAAEDMADFELKAVYEAYYFEHNVVVRNPSRRQLPHGGMPLLTRKGFIDYMAAEMAGGPEPRWRGLQAALERYGVWREMGAVPRSVFPDACPPQLQARIDAANRRSHATAQERITASRVRAEIQAQGRRNAEELVGDYRYVWRPI